MYVTLLRPPDQQALRSDRGVQHQGSGEEWVLALHCTALHCPVGPNGPCFPRLTQKGGGGLFYFLFSFPRQTLPKPRTLTRFPGGGGREKKKAMEREKGKRKRKERIDWTGLDWVGRLEMCLSF